MDLSSGIATKFIGYLKLTKLIKIRPIKIDGHKITNLRMRMITTNESRLRHLQDVARSIDDHQDKGWRGFLYSLESAYCLQNPESILQPIFRTPALHDQPVGIG